jgi:hypothetical protein
MNWQRGGTVVLCLATGWLTSGCEETALAKGDERPRGAAAPIDSASAARLASLEPGALATVTADSVILWTGPGERPFEVARRSAVSEGGHARKFGTITRSIALRVRSADLSQYPCSSCHQGRQVVMAVQRVSDAHQNIQPVHPSQTGALCSTCHAAENVAELALRGGGGAPLVASYQLCGQCHFAEADAWAGGGHGKRLDGWAGRRIVMACTDCHDPHTPAIQSRIPFRAPQIERAQRGQP